MIRTYEVSEEAGEVHLAMFEDGEQVGGGLFPCDASDDAYEMACEVGDDFVGRFNMPADGWDDFIDNLSDDVILLP